MKKLLGYMVLLLLLTVISACGKDSSSAAGEAKAEPSFVRFVASTPGGAWYPPATAMELIISENLENASVRVSPGGGEANAKTVGDGDAEMGYTQTASAGAAYRGESPFEKEFTELRHLFTTTPVGLHLAVKKDSEIKSIEDLKDKRIGMAPEGYLANTVAERLFEVYGFTLEDIKANGGQISYLGLTEGPQSLVDGNIDVYLGQGLWPYGPFMEIDNNPGVRFLEIDEKIIDEFLEKYPVYSKFTIPKDTYKSLDKDLQTVGTYAAVVTHKDVPDEQIYNIVKAIWENVEKVHEASPSDKEWMKLENAVEGISIPVHPGAKKYYEEKGMKVE
ncbi:hypothetical protein WQ57_00500 [Mesobacillus campisalis]|uniref:C4-dicarboxylate ABC transporter substrate-binding protein n=1 Tax=Mesobacillus campisalis TaxID=1408103 RepID=A0A0M2T064_9BACI|nr:TAXI family TRAP transporter solute-binding subunit [Mesobacillus campisalis]KKK39813.1 hypothetical protein WQ57_00500 [Mesobacillus campisalis]